MSIRLKCDTHLTTTVRRHITQGLERGLEQFGTKRKLYRVIKTDGDTVKIHSYDLPLRDGFERRVTSIDKAYRHVYVVTVIRKG